MFKMNDKADAEEAVALLRSMDGQIPSLRSLEAGVNVIDTDRSYDVGIMTTFDDAAGWKEYADHPFHAPVIAWMKAHTATSVAVDYEI